MFACEFVTHPKIAQAYFANGSFIIFTRILLIVALSQRGVQRIFFRSARGGGEGELHSISQNRYFSSVMQPCNSVRPTVQCPNQLAERLSLLGEKLVSTKVFLTYIYLLGAQMLNFQHIASAIFGLAVNYIPIPAALIALSPSFQKSLFALSHYVCDLKGKILKPSPTSWQQS